MKDPYHLFEAIKETVALLLALAHFTSTKDDELLFSGHSTIQSQTILNCFPVEQQSDRNYLRFLIEREERGHGVYDPTGEELLDNLSRIAERIIALGQLFFLPGPRRSR